MPLTDISDKIVKIRFSGEEIIYKNKMFLIFI